MGTETRGGKSSGDYGGSGALRGVVVEQQQRSRRREMGATGYVGIDGEREREREKEEGRG